MGKLKAGDKWYIQLRPNCTLAERKIISATKKTVLLIEFGLLWKVEAQRYLIKDIEFIEKIADE